MGDGTQGRGRSSFKTRSHAKVAEHHPSVMVDEDICCLHSLIIIISITAHSA